MKLHPLKALTLTASLLGFGRIQEGLPLKVVLIVSSMPVAFTALVPPPLYDLDLDLANACWLFTTALLGIMVPTLFLVINLM
jgi:predicted permease